MPKMIELILEIIFKIKLLEGERPSIVQKASLLN
jgi:hypothetical protein